MAKSRWPRAIARGFTFTEVMIVMALASVITLGLVTFYLNSQIMWTDASTQALAQRDATSLIEVMRRSAQGAASAFVDPSGHQVTFYDSSTLETSHYFWTPVDSFVHSGDLGNWDKGPVAPTIVEAFRVTYDPNLGMVSLDSLRVRSSSGQHVSMSTAIGLYNK
jgi:prepilin-type N-terminal cleavage/methylation domain-containing protein